MYYYQFLVVYILHIAKITIQDYTHWKSGAPKHDNNHSHKPLQNHTSEALQKDTTLNYNNMEQIIPRV